MKSFTFVIPIKPEPKLRARASITHGNKIRIVTPSKTRTFEASVALYIRSKLAQSEYQLPPINSEIHLNAIFCFKRNKTCIKEKRKSHLTKPDLSNLLKSVEDSLNGILWKDDSYITKVEMEKTWDDQDYIVLVVKYLA